MDKLTKEQRRKNMQAVKNKDSKIEIILRKALWKRGYRYNKNYTKLIGKPDIVITKYKLAIFCDSEFWHGFDWKNKKKEIKSNRKFWVPKIERNIERDKEVTSELQKSGWTVLRFWGNEIKKNLDNCINKIETVIANMSNKIKFTDLWKDIETDYNDTEILAFLTHYFQCNSRNEVKSYKVEAEKYIDSRLFFPGTDNIEWNIPFPFNKNPRFTFIDLFAGIGGFRIAFQELGGKCVFSSEWDKYSQITYRANFGEVPFGDITKVNEKNIPDHDILLGGFPCQAFSIAGKRHGFKDTRGTLFFDVARIIKEKKPKSFFLENVKGLFNHKSGKTLEIILDVLRNDLNYYVPDPQIINAKNFGVPQNRERIFIVGFRNDLNINNFKYPTPSNKSVCFKDIREDKPVEAKYYLSKKYYDTLVNHKKRHEAKGNGFGFEIIPNDGIANAIVVGGMGRERNLVIDKRQNDFTPTTNVHGKYNTEGIRRMTPREWARLQGFPDNFKIPVSDTQAYKQFGNSVAVPAIKATGVKIIDLLFKKGEIEMLTGNKGEWSEIYTFFKILADGKLYAADSNLNKIEDIFYPVIKIVRNELGKNLEYLRDSYIKIIDGETNKTLISIPLKKFIDNSKLILNKIKSNKSTFPIPEIEKFLNDIHCNSIKAKSTKKSDITIVVHDLNTGLKPTLGFSIKSQLGSPSTLLNAGKTTNFIYEVKKKNIDLKKINSIKTKSKIKDRLTVLLNDKKTTLEYISTENQIFGLNLMVIDSLMPQIISEILLLFYSGEGNTIKELTEKLENINPLKYNYNHNHNFYEYKIKNFLTEIALGMTPNKTWKGILDATGGYIVVKEDGEILCYHIYNRNEFQDYLFNNTKLETASSSRHKFGVVYKDKNQTYFNLNLQIRFIK